MEYPYGEPPKITLARALTLQFYYSCLDPFLSFLAPTKSQMKSREKSPAHRKTSTGHHGNNTPRYLRVTCPERRCCVCPPFLPFLCRLITVNIIREIRQLYTNKKPAFRSNEMQWNSISSREMPWVYHKSLQTDSQESSTRLSFKCRTWDKHPGHIRRRMLSSSHGLSLCIALWMQCLCTSLYISLSNTNRLLYPHQQLWNQPPRNVWGLNSHL